MTAYKKQVESDFSKLQSKHKSQAKNTTGCQDVLQFLVDKKRERIWWWSWEFIGKRTSKGGFLSHRAPARASDLALHTDLVEDRKIGRFKVYRAKLENNVAIAEYLAPKKLIK